MGSQVSAIIGRGGSFGAHDIKTGGPRPHGVDQIQMTPAAAAAAAAARGGGGGGATDHHQEEEEADIEMAADPHAGAEEGANTPGIGDQIPDIHVSAGGGEGATHDQVEGNREIAAGPQSAHGNRDSGIFPSIGAATLSVAAAAILRPTPEGLHSEDLLLVAYTLDLITLLVLGILLFTLTLALALIPDNWVSAVRAAASTVAVALLVLLLFLVALVTYGLVRQGLP